MTLVSELKGDLCIVTNALQKIKKDDKKIDEEDEDADVQDYLLRELTNISRRNSDTQLDCQRINEENKEHQDSKFLDPNKITQNGNSNENGQNSSNDSSSENSPRKKASSE